jgi:CheY-like chemotaxis protein
VRPKTNAVEGGDALGTQVIDFQVTLTPGGGAVSPVNDRLRILVVEDDEDSAELLAEALVDRGHSVEVCREGAAALAATSHFRPHVALLDVGLPGMDGYELARRIRALPLTLPIRLLALTGYGGHEERARARAAGFDAHFVKPVMPDELVEAIESSHPPSPRTDHAAESEEHTVHPREKAT